MLAYEKSGSGGGGVDAGLVTNIFIYQLIFVYKTLLLLLSLIR